VGDDAGAALPPGAGAVMPIRVLLISAEYPPTPGGVGDYTALLATHLAAAGATVSVLTSGSGAAERVGEVTIHRRVSRWDWRVRQTLRAVIEEEQPDTVHLQYQTGMYAMHPAMNFLPGNRGGEGMRPQFVTTFHDLLHPYLFPKAGPLRAWVTRRLARASEAVVVTNGADHATLRAWGVPATMIPIGSNIPTAPHRDAAAIRARYGISPDDALLTTFGLLNQSKGIDTVLDALAILHYLHGLRAHLLLVGAGVGANDATNRTTAVALDARIAANDLTGAVTRTGPLPADDVARALAASDVCLLPYRDGASPRRGSLLAALTQGVPVVTTTPSPHAYDDLPELCDGEAALFFPPGDSYALANAVIRILSDDPLASRLRSGAAAYAAQFAWPTIAERTLALYATLDIPAAVNPAVAAVVAGSDR